MPKPALTPACDVIIIGAGPAGTSAGAILAEAGRKVIILEKERFPRYRVGESLIPYCWFPLQRVGVLKKMQDADFTVKKHSVQFVGFDGKSTTPFYFSKHSDHDSSLTWQVRRDAFDQMLLDNVIDRGAQVLMETAAKSLIREDSRIVGVEAKSADGNSFELRAPMTIDASGRDLFAVSQENWRVEEPGLRKIAIWTYYRGAKRDRGIDEGATTIAYIPEKGWFWYIPLPDDMVSVGIVAEREYLYRGDRDPQAIFDREVGNQPWIREHLDPGCREGEFRVTGDYSYRSRHCATDGLLLVGDAFAFLDPVFSSGMYFALQSGVMAGDAVINALEQGDVSASQFSGYADQFCQDIEAMRRLVFAFYDQSFSFGALMKAHPDVRGDLTDCLIGNLDKDFTALFDAVAQFASIPEPLTYGQPLTI